MKELLQKFLDEGRVEIGGVVYDIELVSSLNTNGEIMQGLIQYNECLISINEDINIQKKLQTLAHEIVHAMLNEANLKQDEDFVERLGLQLYNLK